MNAQLSNAVYPVMKNGLWGLVDSKGKVVEPFKYLEYSKSYQNEMSATCVKLWDGKKMTVFLSNQKKIVYPEGYRDFVRLGNNRFSGSRGGKYFLCDTFGKLVIQNGFNYILSTPVAHVFEFCGDGKNGIMNDSGSRILEFPLIPIKMPSSVILFVQKENSLFIYDYYGNLIARDTFVNADVINYPAHPVIVANFRSSGGVVFNREGKRLFSYPQGVAVTTLNNDFIRFQKNNKIFVLDVLNEKIVEIKPSIANSSVLKNTFIYKEGKYNYYFRRNQENDSVVPYLSITESDGQSWVQDTAGNYGILDTAFRVVVPMKYSSYELFNDPLAAISDEKNNYAVINKRTGKLLSEFIYTDFTEGSTYLKAYLVDNQLDIYDIENGVLSDKVRFKGVKRRAIIQRLDTSDNKVVKSVRSRFKPVEGLNWEYVKIKNAVKLMLVLRDSGGFVQDTIIKPLYDSFVHGGTRFTVIARRDKQFKGVGYHGNMRLYLVNHADYSVFNEIFDYVNIEELDDDSIPVFLAVNNEGKSLLIDKKTFTIKKEYDFISEIEYGRRRAVKKAVRNFFPTGNLVYYGNIIPNRGYIIGNWEILDSIGNHIPISGFHDSSVKNLDPFYLSQAIGMNDAGMAFVVDTHGKIVVPPEYISISRVYGARMLPHYIASRSIPEHIEMISNGTGKLRMEKYRKITEFGECARLESEKDSWILNREGMRIPVIGNVRLKSFYANRGFVSNGKNWKMINDHLENISNNEFKQVVTSPLSSEYFLASNGKMWGVVDSGSNWVIFPKYKGVCGPVYYSSFLHKENAVVEFIRFNGEVLKKPFSNCTPVEEIAPGFFLYSQNGFYHIINSKGKLLVSFPNKEKPFYKFEHLFYFKDEKWLAVNIYSGKSIAIKKEKGIKEIINGNWDRDQVFPQLLDFSDAQKKLYKCENTFYPFLFSGGNVWGRQNLILDKLGYVMNTDRDLGYLIKDQAGKRQNLDWLKQIIDIDTGGLLVKTNYNNLGFVSPNSTWLIPAYFGNLKKLPANNYFSSISSVYDIWDIKGSKQPHSFSGFQQDDHVLITLDSDIFRLFDLDNNKYFWQGE